MHAQRGTESRDPRLLVDLQRGLVDGAIHFHTLDLERARAQLAEERFDLFVPERVGWARA